MTSETTCPICGRERNPQRKYCSRACYAIAQRGHSPANKIAVEYHCDTCGKAFLRPPSAVRHTEGNFCSQQCFGKSHAKFMLGKGRKRIIKTCEQCGKEYDIIPSWEKKSPSRFCSYACMNAFKRTITGTNHPLYKAKILVICEFCRGRFYVIPGRVGKARFCSNQCHGAWTVRYCKSPTTIENQIAILLSTMGLAFDMEKQFARFLCDFFVPALNLVIECDGTYWHASATQKVKDERKNTWLRDHGYNLLRLTENQIRNDIDGCKTLILSFMPVAIRV